MAILAFIERPVTTLNSKIPFFRRFTYIPNKFNTIGKPRVYFPAVRPFKNFNLLKLKAALVYNNLS